MNDVTLREQIVEHLDHNRRQASEQLADDIITIVLEYAWMIDKADHDE